MTKEVCKCGRRSTGYTNKDFDKQSLKAIRDGTIIEFEHTCDPKVARRIAEDHVSELGNMYYVELAKLENKLSKLKQDLPDKRKTKCPIIKKTSKHNRKV